MDKFFSVFGKLVLIVLILGAVAYLFFNLGKRGSESVKEIQSEKVNQGEVNTATSVSPSPTIAQKETIEGGVDKSAGLSFSQYTIKVPSGWTQKRESQTQMDEKLILTKGDYQISIFQAATGGALCLYPGDADFEGPSSKFTIFKDIQTEDGLSLRRSGTNTVGVNGKVGFTMCQKSTDGSFGQPTNYGHISISLSKGYLESVLSEIDEILSSLQKQ